MTRQPESSIVGAILRDLNAAPNTYARKVHGNAYSSAWPDIVGCTNGTMFAIEVKQPGRKASARQAHELAKWKLAGARVGVATSVDEAREIAWPMLRIEVPGRVNAQYIRPGGRIDGGRIVESWIETNDGEGSAWVREEP